MRLDDLVFVTSNMGKLREAEAVLERSLAHRGLDLPEPQTLDLAEVVRTKAKAAFEHLGRPVLVEDTALELAGLGGFPGPLVRWLLSSVGPEGICRIADCFGDFGATARCLVCATDGTVEVFGEGAVEGTIVRQPRGDGGFGWDTAFAPIEGGGRTYGEMTEDEKNCISHRHQAFVALRDALATHPPDARS
jgi:non-canonical purine NTP pyrophosphatase (RdgB/HAM1 family)